MSCPELDVHARIDHRLLEAQNIELELQHKISPTAPRKAAYGLKVPWVAECQPLNFYA